MGIYSLPTKDVCGRDLFSILFNLHKRISQIDHLTFTWFIKLKIVLSNKCWCAWVANAIGSKLIQLYERRFEFCCWHFLIDIFFNLLGSDIFWIFLAIGSFGHRDSYHLPPIQKYSSSNQKVEFVLESEKIITSVGVYNFFPSPPFAMFWSNLLHSQKY